MPLSKTSDGVYIVASHHFRALVPGECCVNKSRPCEGLGKLTDLMDYAKIAKQGDAGVSHWGLTTAQEVSELGQARTQYLEWMSKVSVY